MKIDIVFVYVNDGQSISVFVIVTVTEISLAVMMNRNVYVLYYNSSNICTCSQNIGCVFS